MPRLSSFTHQDLRGHSFRHQNLQHAQFWHCDLRGCDFERANLQGARLVGCRLGRWRQPWRVLVGLLPLAGAVGMALSGLLFASLGVLPGQAAWAYVQILAGVLAVTTVAAGLQTAPWPLRRGARLGLGATLGALVGFFYVGTWTHNDPTFALGGALGLSLLGATLGWSWATATAEAGLGVLGAMGAYGETFWLWTHSSSLLTTGQWGPGLGWGGLALGSLALALRSGLYGLRLIYRGRSTSFHGANRTDCTIQSAAEPVPTRPDPEPGPLSP